jgi:ribonuclease P protein component
MLPKRSRLTTTAFNQFFKAGRRYHHPLLQVIYTPHPHFHGAVVVGKKVAKQAVKRNELRRQLYATLYHHAKAGTTTGVYIVILKPPALAASRAERRAALIDTLAKVPTSATR